MMTEAVTTVEHAIDRFIKQLSGHENLWIAYSGGVDSHVLLHRVHIVLNDHPTIKLHAIHINHQLQPHADQWQQHCQQICQHASIDYHSQTITVTPTSRQSLEAIARRQRYQALSSYLDPSDYLLTAHHQNDQVETLLLQLFRGAGPQGLAAMPKITTLGSAHLARPLLDVRRETIIAYAKNHSLQWVEDESNQSLQFDRNFLRHQLLPEIIQRYPAAYRTITRSAELCAEASDLMATLAEIDLTIVQLPDSKDLSADKLKKLSPPRQRNVIRYWLAQQTVQLPSAIKLQHILTDVIHSNYQRMPCVTLDNASVKREKDRIFICIS